MSMITSPMKDGKYAARVWRTKVLKQEAAEQIEVMLRAFIPENFTLDISEHNPGQKWCCGMDGFHHKLEGIIHCKDKDGSDAHFCAQANTREGVMAGLLKIIVDGRGFFPLT